MMKSIFFFFNDTATTEIYTLSLHDALPICDRGETSAAEEGGNGHAPQGFRARAGWARAGRGRGPARGDRKSTRLNSSHANISYAVFCLKKKKIENHTTLSITIDTISVTHPV